MNRGERYRLTIERPAAGGRMIARHDGAIVFVAGAIPGEEVEAEVEKVQRGTVWAITREVIEASPDRVDRRAGRRLRRLGVRAHRNTNGSDSSRPRLSKTRSVASAGSRWSRRSAVTASPIDGYRMRARLHVRNGRIGFFREGTHSLCDAGPTRQLREDTIAVIAALELVAGGERPGSRVRDRAVGEPRRERACLPPGAAAKRRPVGLDGADADRRTNRRDLRARRSSAHDGVVGLAVRDRSDRRRAAVASCAIVLPGQPLPDPVAGRARHVVCSKRGRCSICMRAWDCSACQQRWPRGDRLPRSKAIGSQRPICKRNAAGQDVWSMTDSVEQFLARSQAKLAVGDRRSAADRTCRKRRWPA